MKLHKQERGSIVAFEYFDRVDECWKPRVAVVLTRKAKRLTLCFDVARGNYRSFHSKRVRHLRIVSVIAADKTELQARCRAEGFRDGAGPGWGVVHACQDRARVAHGLDRPHAVFAVEKQPLTA